MDRTPPPTMLAAALALPRTPGRSAEVFVDGDLEIRFAARPTDGPQIPHLRDELYVVAAGTGRYRVEGRVSEVGAGDLLFAAAHAPHGFIGRGELLDFVGGQGLESLPGDSDHAAHGRVNLAPAVRDGKQRTAACQAGLTSADDFDPHFQ